VPPVLATTLVNPEVMGQSAGGVFVVTDSVVDPADVPALLVSLGVHPPVAVGPVECDLVCGPGASMWYRHGLLSCIELRSHSVIRDTVGEGKDAF
jgi:hypothetical protein